MAVNRPPYIVVASGSNGAGAITTGSAQSGGGATQVGDIVTAVVQIVDAATPAVVVAQDTFERIVSVAGQIQQTSASNLSGNTYVWFVFPQGWKSIQ